MASQSASYSTIAGPAGGLAVVKIGDTEITGYTPVGMAPADAKAKDAEFKKQIRDALNAAG